jgi:hypothetical protein
MLRRHLWDLEQEEVARFKVGAGLVDPHEEVVRRAKAIGAHEVYSYLLTMDEEDINETHDTVLQEARDG